MKQLTPTIKGLFFNSHIKAVRNKFGDDGVKRLEEILGKPLRYSNSSDVPVQEEAELINAALTLLYYDGSIPEEKRDFEAGRLHFQNFITTPFANIIFSIFRHQFKLVMLNAHNIAGHIFKGMEFYPKDIGPNAVHMVIRNDYYPLDHFRGLFTAWMEYSGLTGSVHAREVAPHVHEYYFEWKDPDDTST